MIKHTEISEIELLNQVRSKEICLGGNMHLKIFGTLKCKSGKRLKRLNRVFFMSESEAIKIGYRPCGHCMKVNYQKWKSEFI